MDQRTLPVDLSSEVSFASPYQHVFQLIYRNDVSVAKKYIDDHNAANESFSDHLSGRLKSRSPNVVTRWQGEAAADINRLVVDMMFLLGMS